VTGAAIRVLLAEGASEARHQLAGILRSDSALTVVREVATGADAVELARRLRPDIVVINIRMPGLSGLDTTKRIMIEAPTPIVVVAPPTDALAAEASVAALRAGALALVSDPTMVGSAEFKAASRDFAATVKAMAQVKVVRRRLRASSKAAMCQQPPEVIAIAASTGGPAALQRILAALPARFPVPILLVQHIAQGFGEGFVAWLGSVCSLRVKAAEHGEPLAPHTVYVAVEDAHLGVSSRGVQLSPADPIGGFRPSASYLFESVAATIGSNSIHVILTGMGRDGVDGLRTVRQRGGRVIAQDEATSVVFGMPGAAVAAGVVDEVLSLEAIAAKLTASLSV
jgi:two-component system, chemotaxis family, protein-glutamate methylesterase/glutaminase